MNRKALVVHSRRTGLALIRALGKKGVEVFCADTYKAEGFFSRYTKRGIVLPELIKIGNDALLTHFVDIARSIDSENSKPYLFTGSDDYLMFFVKNWDVLSIYYRPSFETDLKVLKSCLEKKEMYKTAERADVLIPKTYYSPLTANEVNSYPVIIKPSLKKTDKVDVVKSAFRIEKAYNKDELNTYMGMLNSLNVSFVVQEYIEGGDDSLYTAGIYTHKGKLIAGCTGRKLRQYPPELGECSFGELITEPQLIESARRLVKEAKLTGICQVEFKKDKGKFYLMEINPRPWSWISLIDYAGINLPYTSIECHENFENCQSQKFLQTRDKGTWMFPVMDLKYNVLINKNISVLKFFKNLFSSNRLAFFKWSDPMPIFCHVYYAIFYEYINPYLKSRRSK